MACRGLSTHCVVPGSIVIPCTPVNRFRFHVLQEQRGGLVISPAEISFNTPPPSWAYNLSELARRPIPLAKYLQSLETCLNNRPSNGARLSSQSIHSSTNREGLLPLCVLIVRDDVLSLISSRNRWMPSLVGVSRILAGKSRALDVYWPISRLRPRLIDVILWTSRDDEPFPPSEGSRS